jgi:hypothetical protein
MNKKFLPALLLFVTGFAQAQQTLTNSGNLQVHSGATVTGFGSFVNTSTGVLVNNGSLYIRGNITNDQASMSAGAGTLHLDGSSAQALGGAQALRTFRLVTNNAAGITLNNNLRVADLHTFSNGIITTSATPNYLVYEAGSSYTGSSDTRHVNGWVKKIGSTGFAYPVGNGTYERRITVANLSAASEFNVRHRTNTGNYNSVQYPLFQADRYEYWEVNRVSGGMALINMNWDNSKITFPDYVLSELRVSWYNGGAWVDQGGTAIGNVFTTGSVSSNTVNSFGMFAIASIGWTLPMKFISVAAEREQNDVVVEWKTAQEFNVDHFEIERSGASSDFRQIGTVNALNNGNGGQYAYTDQMPLPGTAWYRIKGLDKDGKTTYSEIAIVRQNNTDAFFKVLNNPASEAILLSASAGYSGAYGYELYNNAGQLMQKGNINLGAYGVTRIALGQKIIPGVYVLHVRNEEHRLTEKIIVK